MYLEVWLGLGLLLLVLVPLLLSHDWYDETVLGGRFRGRYVQSLRASQRAADRLCQGDGEDMYWSAGLRLPVRVATTNRAYISVMGGGKSQLMQLEMQSVLPRIGTGRDWRALINDAKRELWPVLSAIDIPAPILCLNPLDCRSVRWDIARDCTGPTNAGQLASILVPDDGDHANAFFRNAARDLLEYELTGLILGSPGRWTLRDVVLAAIKPWALQQIVSRTAIGKDMFTRYGADERTWANVHMGLLARLNRFATVAACWDHAAHSISITQWLESESILLLSSKQDAKYPVDTLNRLFFARLTDLVLSLPQSFTRRIWLYLDEIRQMGKLPGLGELLTLGRGVGVAASIAVQDIVGVHQSLGRETADEVIGQHCSKTIMRLENPETAKWASNYFGEYEEMEVNVSHTTSSQGGSTTWSQHMVRREAVLPSQFLTIPLCNPADGLQAFCTSPVTPAFHLHIDWQYLRAVVTDPCPDTAGFVPRPAEHEYLRDWNDDDLQRLGLIPPRPAADGRPKVVGRRSGVENDDY